MKGFGNIYIEMSANLEAKWVWKLFDGRMFDNKLLRVTFHDHAKYIANDFSDPELLQTGWEEIKGFEGMEHIAIEFKDGDEVWISTVQNELRATWIENLKFQD